MDRDLQATVAELVAALPDGVVATAPEVLEKYRFDWTHHATAGMPLAAVRAEDAGHVRETLRWAKIGRASCRERV